MKNSIKAFLFFTALLALGCNKELNTVPTESIDQQDALNTSSDVKVALVGCYSDFGRSSLYGGRALLQSDLLGDFNEIDFEGTYQELIQIHNKTIPVDNGFVANTWLAGYKVINDVNNVLGALSVVDDASKDRVEGEAKFMRGATYFELVKVYAKDWSDGSPTSNPGVPLVLEPTRGITEASKVARNTVAEVYAQVISDLTTAQSKLPDDNGIYADKAAAAAMLAGFTCNSKTMPKRPIWPTLLLLQAAQPWSLILPTRLVMQIAVKTFLRCRLPPAQAYRVSMNFILRPSVAMQ